MPSPLSQIVGTPRTCAVVDRPGGNGKVAQEEPLFRPHTIGRCMHDVEPCSIHWLWPDRIPQARLTVFAGDGGVGKSFLSLAIAATLSRGAGWPDQPDSKPEPGTTVLLNAEDDPNDTLRVRLDACGADCRRIHIVEAVQRCDKGEFEYFSLLDDLRALEDKIEATGARLCLIDPLGAYLTVVDSHKDSSVRIALGPLAGLASRTGCAVVAIMHINKARGISKISDRVCGSVAFTNAARMAWFIGVDPEDEHRRLMLPYKFNIIERPTGLAFRIEDGRVLWEPGPVTIDADSILKDDCEDRTERKAAQEWLEDYLLAGSVKTAEIQRAARANCHSWPTVRRAKDSLRLKVHRHGFGKDGHYTWELPTESN